MGIRIFWDNDDKTILHQVFEPDWTIADYHYAMDMAYNLISTRPRSVDVIIDLSRSEVQPTRILNAALSRVNPVPLNLGSLVIVKPETHFQAAFELGKRIMTGVPAQVVNTVDDSYRVITQQRTKTETIIA